MLWACWEWWASLKAGFRAYPHELSGGMRQRVVIAMALANNPALVIADEPTTGLDVFTQNEILAIIKELGARLGLSMIFISHDLLTVLLMPDHLAVMYQGKFVEEGPAEVVATAPTHPYTRELLEAIPRLRRSKTGTVVLAGNAPGIISGPARPDKRSEG